MLFRGFFQNIQIGLKEIEYIPKLVRFCPKLNKKHHLTTTAATMLDFDVVAQAAARDCHGASLTRINIASCAVDESTIRLYHLAVALFLHSTMPVISMQREKKLNCEILNIYKIY